MALEREVTDGITGDDVVIYMDGIRLFNAENLDWEETQEKEELLGTGGKGKAFGRLRKGKKYPISLTIIEVNQALLVPPEEFRPGQGDVKVFNLDGTEYASLMDLRNLTITARYPNQDGTTRVLRWKNFEFTKNAGSIAVDDALKRSLDGTAILAEGLI